MWVRTLTLTFTPKSSSQSHLLQFFRSSPSPLPPPTMPYNNRGRPAAAREQWKPKTQPSTSAAAPSAVASATDHISRLSIADTADPSSSSSATARAHSQPDPPLLQFGTLTPQARPPPLQFGTLTPPARHQRGVWMPKSYGTVSSTPVAEASATVTAAPAAQTATPITIPQKESNIDVRNLSKLFSDFNVDNNTFSEAKIRATFYPKFENEKSDQEIRLKMIDVVSHGQGIVEVSLKHSGSLFMYAGHLGGAFAKNSYGNIYTAVGVFVLGRTLRMAWGREAERKQAEFNDFLEKNRMCISMELVTAVLGDHGQRPINDYVVVTAIAELGHGKPKFYSTPDLIAFCRQWRLPTNHVWLFSTRKSVTSFFAAYDALCEEGTATPVCKVLDEVADISVPGSKDHIKEQGEILEGLVARIVSHDSSKHMEEVLRDFHPPPVDGVSQDLGPSLREICAANRSDEKQQIKALLENAGSSICPYYSDWFGNGDASSHSRNADRSVITKFLQAHPMDYSTIKLQEMIRVMRQNNFSVAFKCYYNFHMVNSLSSESLYSRMVIHVQNDSVFRRYQNEMRRNHGLWPLYRGFFVDLNLFKVNKDRASELAKESNSLLKNPNDSSNSTDGLADENENLMIKLKFLTYKIRTFLIRNGLSILFQGGPSAYKSYYLKQMRIWKTSYGKQKELSKMLDEWAIYILRKYGNRQLSSSTYLSEAEPFLEQYAKRSPANQVLVGAAGNLVRAENFLAIIEGSRDEEGDLHPVGEPSPSSSVIVDKVLKHEGLIVFFPGIPGCAKSALCKEILNSPGVLGDNRPVHSPMGDLIKGKYWQIVEAERKKMPYAITLADKNAPNIEVWEQIEKMCRTTKASAVPVVADSEGTDSNPYSLDALAVFIYRVLHRVNHPGKLDKNSDNPGYVLLMFYHLYEGKNRKEFESELYERFGALVKMPLLKTDRNPLPDPVKAILEKGINLYRLHTNKHSRLDPKKGAFARDWSDWEKRLRAILFGNSDYLDSIQVPFDFAVKQVIEQLKDIVKRENQPTTPDTEKRKFGNIVYAAVTLPVVEVISLLEKLAVTNPEVKDFLEDKSLESNLKSAHVTLAHKRSHGVAAVASYGAFVQQNVPVQLTGLLLSSNAAALEARLGSVNGEIISSKNEWPHVTIWTAAGTAAKDANLLPQLLGEGKAKQIVIDPPVTVSGVLDFY